MTEQAMWLHPLFGWILFGWIFSLSGGGNKWNNGPTVRISLQYMAGSDYWRGRLGGVRERSVRSYVPL